MFPPRTILAAVDFSEQARGALMFAALLAQRCEARLHVVCAEEPLLAAAAAANQVDLHADTRFELTRFIASASPADVCHPESIVTPGDAAAVILQAARRTDADLLVLGARGMSGAGRLLFGSVTERVVLQSTRPVLVVPDWWASLAPVFGRLGPIVAAVDFSPPSQAALTAACALAERLQTTVEAVHVVPSLSVPERWQAYAAQAVADRVAAARADLTRMVARLASRVPVVARVEEGPVVERLTEVAMAIDGRNPILILGRREAASECGVPGAIAYRVASMTRVPVLMHRDGAS